MERLTFEGLFCDIAMCREIPCPYDGMCSQRKTWERLKEYEDTGLEPEQVMELKSFIQGGIHKVDDGWKHVQDLIQAEQDGRLVVLPCKVGDTVYQVDYMTHSEALKSGVPQSKDPYQNRKYGKKRAEYLPLIVREKKMVKSLFRDFGKTVFLTREEAEVALKGGEG